MLFLKTRLYRRVTSLALGLFVLLSAYSLADVVHFHNGKVLRGKLSGATGDLFEFKPSFFRTQSFQRLELTNRHDIIEMRNMQKFFGEIIYANSSVVEIATAAGHTQLNRWLIRNIVLGAPDELPVEIPAQPPNGGFPATRVPATSMENNAAAASNQRVPLQNEKPVFLFPPAKAPSEDRDAINTDDRVP